MRKGVLFCILWLAGFTSGDAKEFKIVCYFASWAAQRSGNGAFGISNIDPTRCTHLIYAFVGITEDGGVDILGDRSEPPDEGGRGGFGKFLALRELSPETKFMVSIGGWDQGSVRYSKVMANSSLRSNFVKNVVNFTLRHDFDGFDVDWEYPNQRNGTEADVENFVLLLKELRAVFDEHDLIWSAAVAAEEASASLSYNISEVSRHLDFVSVMTFDFHEPDEPTIGHNAPLYPARREITKLERGFNVNASVNYWLDQGTPPEKLILSTAFYGQTYTLNNSAENEPGSWVTGAGKAGEYTGQSGVLAYHEICVRVANKSWTTRWDEEQRVPYAYLGDQWISYDNVESITEKANFIKERGLGGAMIWSIDMDDFRGICGEPNPLLNALNVALRGGDAEMLDSS